MKCVYEFVDRAFVVEKKQVINYQTTWKRICIVANADTSPDTAQLNQIALANFSEQEDTFVRS